MGTTSSDHTRPSSTTQPRSRTSSSGGPPGSTGTSSTGGRAIGRELGADDVEPLHLGARRSRGATHSGGDLLRAVEAAQAASRRVASWWADDGYDLLLTPTCAEPPPRLGELDAPPDNPLAPIVRAIPFATFTAGFNTTGQPAISLPLHDDAPTASRSGSSWSAAFGREDLLLRVAAQLEEAHPWADRTPPVHAAREPSGQSAG